MHLHWTHQHVFWTVLSNSDSYSLSLSADLAKTQYQMWPPHLLVLTCLAIWYTIYINSIVYTLILTRGSSMVLCKAL